jgi:hypothetical protein
VTYMPFAMVDVASATLRNQVFIVVVSGKWSVVSEVWELYQPQRSGVHAKTGVGFPGGYPTPVLQLTTGYWPLLTHRRSVAIVLLSL